MQRLSVIIISYRTTRTEAWILDCISRLCSKLIRTMFFWNKTQILISCVLNLLQKKKIQQRARVEYGGLERKWLTKLTCRSLVNTNPAKERHIQLPAEERQQSQITFSVRGREDKYKPPSTWARPRWKRTCTDFSDRVGFAANSLKNKTVELHYSLLSESFLL